MPKTSATDPAVKQVSSVTPWLLVVLAVVLFSGTLFGYDQGVISGALHGIEGAFSLGPLMVEVVTSWVTLGALAGSLAGGELADRIGRRPTVMVAAVLFTAGSMVEALAPGTAVLVIGRLIVGTGVGVAAVAAPLYAAEMAPSSLRGRFVASYQFAIAGGIFVAYLTDGWLARSGAWRWMLGIAAVPGLLLLLAAFVTPESPRWLMRMHRRPEALAAARKVHTEADPDHYLDGIAAALRSDHGGKARWSEVFQRRWRRPLSIGVGLAVFQQITGINAIIYYADQIFASAGFTTTAAQTTATTWAVGGVNVAATLIALAYIDRLGRRRLLLAGLFGMGFSLLVVGLAFHLSPAPASAVAGPSAWGIVTLVSLVAYIACFAFSMGPVVWTVINEIFPGRIRGRAVAVATAVNWGAAFLVSEGFLSLIGAIGNAYTFWLFAVFCGLGWVWVYRAVPETKGRSLEQIQQIWAGETP